MKRRVIEIENSNEIATLALTRTKAAIRRQRLEYAVLLERLEDRAIHIPNGPTGFEEMASPPVPSILDESLSNSTTKAAKSGLIKKNTKKSKASPLAAVNGATVAAPKVVKNRDPDMPKRPTNAYLIFCEMEKERIKQESEDKPPGVMNDFSRSMTEAWKNLDEEARKPYYKLYEDDRMRYQTEMTDYNAKKQETPSEGDDGEDRAVKRLKTDTLEDTETPEPSTIEFDEDDDNASTAIKSEPPEEDDTEDGSTVSVPLQ